MLQIGSSSQAPCLSPSYGEPWRNLFAGRCLLLGASRTTRPVLCALRDAALCSVLCVMLPSFTGGGNGWGVTRWGAAADNVESLEVGRLLFVLFCLTLTMERNGQVESFEVGQHQVSACLPSLPTCPRALHMLSQASEVARP